MIHGAKTRRYRFTISDFSITRGRAVTKPSTSVSNDGTGSYAQSITGMKFLSYTRGRQIRSSVR